MKNKFFVFTLFTIFTLVTIAMYSGHAHEEYPHDNDLPASEYTDVHGIFYAHWIRKGNYTLGLTVSEPEADRWK